MTNSTRKKVLIIPCSGVGKVHGLMAREVTFRVVDELQPKESDTLCLALLVKGEEEALQGVRTQPCITIDGCAKLCAYKNVELAGGQIARSIRVLDGFKDHKGAHPGTATALEEDGWTITEELAREVAAQVPRAVGPRSEAAMTQEPTKVGIISCAGEEIPEGTISRLAVRRVLEHLRPGEAVSVCLPLFLAGDGGERDFAREYPTIAIDGCGKRCAKWGTEKYSGPVSAALVVTEILKHAAPLSGARSCRCLCPSDQAAIELVADRISEAMDVILDSEL